MTSAAARHAVRQGRPERKVTLLTFEPDRGDLDGDGDTTDPVLQGCDFCANVTTTLGKVATGDLELGNCLLSGDGYDTDVARLHERGIGRSSG